MAPDYGGTLTVLKQLARAQARAGLAVEILTTADELPALRYNEPVKALLEGDTIPTTSYPVQMRALRVSIGLAGFLRDRAAEFDIIHVHGLYRFPQSYAARFARVKKLPYVVTLHGALAPYIYAQSSKSVRLKRLYERFVDMPNLRGASAIHYTAEGERRQASFLHLKTPSFVVPNGLEWAQYERLPPRGALRARFGLGSAPVILFLGRLHPVKGVDLLIDAFDTVRRSFRDARLLIVGPNEGGYSDQIRRWVSERSLNDNVLLAGPLYGPDVIQAYRDADIFALPSHSENFGMTAVEALACELPIVISDQVNIHAEVAAASVGIVTRRDAGELAAALSSLLADAGRRRSMGEAGRAFVQASYAWPPVIQNLTNEYQRILERSAR